MRSATSIQDELTQILRRTPILWLATTSHPPHQPCQRTADFDTSVGMQLNLTQQRVAVFGAARGIGRAIAEEFIREGCVVHGVDRDGSVPPLSSGSPLIPGDVTAYDQMRAVADRITEVDH